MNRSQTSMPASSKMAPITVTEAAVVEELILSEIDFVALFRYPRHS